jgi:hypothetical protein
LLIIGPSIIPPPIMSTWGKNSLTSYIVLEMLQLKQKQQTA